MPELPEVQTICAYLAEKAEGKTIERVHVWLPRMLKCCSAELFCKKVAGRKIERISRKGKYITLSLSGEVYVIIHLRMTGRLIYEGAGQETEERYERIRFSLTDQSAIIFGDTRTLGVVYLMESLQHTGIATFDEMGVDPLEDAFTPQRLGELMRGHRANIKAFLLNQKNIGGLGNIYADEALFLSGIHPFRRCSSLREEEVRRLHQAIRDCLRQSLEAGGTSFRDYRNGSGERGKNQELLNVYGRKGKRCLACGSLIEYDKISGRGTHYCPRCQR